MMNPYFQRTIAQTRTAPRKVSAPVPETLQLGFFTFAKIIDLACVGDKKPSMKSDDPNELDLSVMSFMSYIDPKDYGYSEKQISDTYIFSQLGLLFDLCENKSQRLVPGFSKETDLLIVERLRNALSENIVNKEEVVTEFITLWNLVATYPIASPHLGTKPNNEETRFTYHEKYRLTVMAFLQQISDTICQSTTFKIMEEKTRKDPNLAENFVRQILAKMIDIQKETMLNPPSFDLASCDLMKQIAHVADALTDPSAPVDSQKLNKTIAPLIYRDESEWSPGYTAFRQERYRGRERNKDKDRDRSRSRSPQRHKPDMMKTDKADRARDRDRKLT